MSDGTKYGNWMRYSTVGMEFIIIVGLFIGGGLWLDKRLGLMPLFTLIGSVAGFAGGLYRLIRRVKEIGDKVQPEDKGEGDGI